jgi:hypothetical protein
MNNIAQCTLTQDIHGSPERGATSTNSNSSLLSFVNILTGIEHQNQILVGQEICVHLTIYSFPM